ncbi:MAG TPA: type II CAAX endopeptidase family protein [Solirubrobacterales bacterium]|nr:type II CAAX endopeptidase family protein [Solirubrobacterales bacterium]
MEGKLATAPGERPARFPYATWGPGAATIGLFVALSAQTVSGLVAFAFEPGAEDFSTAAMVVLQTFGAIAFVAIPLVIATMGRVPLGDALRRLGLRRFDSSAVPWMGVAIAAYLAFAAVYVALVGEPEQEDVAGSFGSWPVQVLLIVVAAPISEEIFFRGMMFGGLRRRMPTLLAALISAVVFGGLHAGTGVSAVPPLIAFGFILALLYEKTGSIVPAILLHALNNSVALAAQ